MGVNSITADKLLAVVFGQFLCVCTSSLIFLIHGYFMTFISVQDLFYKVKRMKLFKYSLKTAWHQVKLQIN